MGLFDRIKDVFTAPQEAVSQHKESNDYMTIEGRAQGYVADSMRVELTGTTGTRNFSRHYPTK